MQNYPSYLSGSRVKSSGTHKNGINFNMEIPDSHFSVQNCSCRENPCKQTHVKKKRFTSFIYTVHN